MRHLAYKIVALCGLTGALLMGMAVYSGAAFIKEQASEKAILAATLDQPLRYLVNVNVRDI